MNNNRLAYNIFSLSVTIALLMPLFYLSKLPDQIISHFNTSGKADEWMDKTSFVIFNYGLVVFILAIFAVIIFLIKKTPNSFINLPNKEYWLSPERREKSLNVFKSFLLLTCSSTLIFITLLMQRSYSFSIQGKTELGWTFWLYLGSFLCVELFLVIKLLLYFNIKREQ